MTGWTIERTRYLDVCNWPPSSQRVWCTTKVW